MNDFTETLARVGMLPIAAATQIVQADIARTHEQAERENARRTIAERSRMNRAQRRAAARAREQEQR